MLAKQQHNIGLTQYKHLHSAWRSIVAEFDLATVRICPHIYSLLANDLLGLHVKERETEVDLLDRRINGWVLVAVPRSLHARLLHSVNSRHNYELGGRDEMISMLLN